MKLLLTGASGQLCKAFIRTCALQDIPYSAPAQSEFDICNPQQVTKYLDALKPDVLINTAAYNRIDQADAFPTAAQRPFLSALSNHALSKTLGFVIPSWQDTLSRYCDNLEKP